MTDVESDAVSTTRTRCFSTIKDKITKTLSAAGGRPAIPGIITNNKITLKNMVISLAVLGLEVLLYSEVFDCPAKHHEIYALSWLCAPPAIIFFVNLLIIGDIWKLSDRCLVRDYYHFGYFCGHTVPSIVKAMAGASVWLILAFYRKDYYVCAEVGPDIREINETDPEKLREYDIAVETAGAESQIFAWAIFLLMVFLTSVMVISKNCCLKDQDILDDMRIFEEREAKWAKKTFTEFARGLHDEEITNENETGGQEKEREDEVKITLYPNGIPEKFGERMVTEMFKGYKEKNPKWHYRDAYDQFKKLYPRAANGHPGNRWSTTHLSKQFAKKAYAVNTDENTKLPVHQTRYGSTSLGNAEDGIYNQ